MTTTTQPHVATDEPVLTPKLNPRWALSLWQLGLVVFWCVFFLVLNFLPLRGTDLWGHVAYGDWILENSSLPAEDPFAPLAEGMHVVASAWLSQVIYALAERYGGGEALSALFAITTLATFLVLARTFYTQSRLPLIAFLSVLVVLVIGWSRVATIRPENFAALCFACLLWLVVGFFDTPSDAANPRRGLRSWLPWLGLVLLMATWANLHGSFVCGLAVLSCSLLGRIVEVAWETRDWRTVVGDRTVRKWLYVCEVATLATLLNPYGIDLLLYTLLFSGNGNLSDVLEWQPLVILGVGGREFAFSWVALVFILRKSPRRVPVAHVLLLLLFSTAVVSGVRMITWYAAVYGLVITPHLSYLAKRYLPEAWTHVEGEPILDTSEREGLAIPVGRRWTYSLVGLLLVWITVALAPIGRPLLGDAPRPANQLLDAATPLTVTAFLNKKPPTGQIFNPQWWGDWLVWDGPAGLQPFVTTNMHVVPRQVWEDYHIILGARSGWQRALERYNIETIVIDKNQQTVLAGLMRRSSTWRLAFEDEQALVLNRRPHSDTRSRQLDGSSGETDAPAELPPEAFETGEPQ